MAVRDSGNGMNGCITKLALITQGCLGRMLVEGRRRTPEGLSHDTTEMQGVKYK